MKSLSLRIKILIIIVLVSIALIYSLYLVTSSILLKSYTNLETKDALNSVNKALEAYTADIDYLHSKLGDWADWDDTYNYVKKPNKTFITTNILEDTFEQLNINLIIISDNNGKILVSREYDFNSHQIVPISPWWTQTLSVEHKLIQQDEKKDTTGLLVIENKPMLVSIRPILTSNGTGPVAGTIIFARYLDQTMINKLVDRVKYPLLFIPYSTAAIQTNTFQPQLPEKNMISVLPQNENTMYGYALINDIYGQPALILREELPRDILNSGKASIKIFTIIFGLFGVILIIVIMMTLEIGVLRRLLKLTREVKEIGKKGLLTAKVSNFGNDELGIFAKTFNQTVIELETITEEKAYQQSQKESLLGIMGEGVIVCNKSGKIIYVNPACEKLLKYTFDELKDKQFSLFFTLYDINDKPLPKDNLENIIAGQSKGSVTRVFIQGKNSKVPVLISMAPIIVNHKYEGMIWTIYDYTPELEKQRQKDDFFSFASHELRTPLAVISNSLKLILSGYGKSTISDVDKKYMLTSVESTDRLKRLVDEFLNISRIEQGKVTFDLKKIDICELINEICKEMNIVYSLKGLYLKCENLDIPVNVLADVDKLKAILINILGNSLKFTERGGVTVSMIKDEKQVKIKISDTGIGIPEKKQKYLFKKFERGTEGMKIEGTGLGLYICKQFIDGMKGNIWIEKSEEGKGTTFAMIMPLAQ